MVKLALREESYLAELAAVSYHLNFVYESMTLSVRGYTEGAQSLALYLARALKTVSHLPDLGHYFK